MYRVKETITSLVHGKQFVAGAQLYGNEFPAYAFAAMLADGVIEKIDARPAPAADEPAPAEDAAEPAPVEVAEDPDTEAVPASKKGKKK